jgi:DNA integrity scanning protein DisA with diadenylate cyclase activity
MPLPRQTTALLASARRLAEELPARAVLVIPEMEMNWAEVRNYLGPSELLVATRDWNIQSQLQGHEGITLVPYDPTDYAIDDRVNLAVLGAIRAELLQKGDQIVVLYNGIESMPEAPEPVDSISVVHLGEHLDSLSSRDLRRLQTQVPLDTLNAVMKLALAIGREGREGHPVGTMFVVGDTRRVLTMCTPLNFNPFRGYSEAERDVKSRQVREQIKDLAQLEGAFIIRREGIAMAACMQVQAPSSGVRVSKGLGTRHLAAASISRHTKAIAICVSQSSGTVRLFHNGEQKLHIEPFKRPLTFGRVAMDRMNGVMATRPGVPEPREE